MSVNQGRVMDVHEIVNKLQKQATGQRNGEGPAGNIDIEQNGVYDVTDYAQATVQVPNTYAAGDEGKVVSNGALVSQTAHADITPTTADQTIDTTLNNSIKVKGDADLIAGNIKKDVEIFGVTGSYEGSGGGRAITLLNTVEVTEQVRAVNVDISDYSSLYNYIFIYIDAELTASDWLYYIIDGSSPSGGTYQNSMQNHEGICFIQIQPAPGNSPNIVLAGVVGNSVLTIGNRNGIPVSNIYVYCYTETKYFKTGSKFRIYGGNYADM